MVESIGSALLAPEIEDRMMCQVAAEASSESKPIMPVNHVDPLFFVESEWSGRVLKGLARISLEDLTYDYSGLSQPKANYIIGELSGSVDDFIYDVLRNARTG